MRGALTLAGNADGPPFDRPARGWYWQVTRSRQPAALKRSLDGTSRSIGTVLADHPPPPPPDRDAAAAAADGPGPNDQALHYRIQHVVIGARPCEIVATAPRMAVMGPLREAMATLALSLAVLGLALVLAIVLQVRLGLRPLDRLRQAVADVRAGRAGASAERTTAGNSCRW
jgi:hypothetical protein